MRQFKRSAALAATYTLLGLLSACGGGGGSSAPPVAPPPPAPVVAPAAPVVSASFAVKRMNLSWTSVAGATSYRLERDVDGISGWESWGSTADAAATSLERFLPTHLMDWSHAAYRLMACNATGCTPSQTFFTTALQQHQTTAYFKPLLSDNNDSFGNRIAISGDGRWMAVAMPGEDSGDPTHPGDDSVNNSGAVVIYRRDATGAWYQNAYLKAPDIDTADLFGTSLALSDDGSTLAIGAENDDSAATGIDGSYNDETAPQAGAVYVYARTSVWTLQSYIKASNAEAGDEFGGEVSLSGDGNTLAVGALQEDGAVDGINGNQNTNLADGAGAVYLFTRNGAAWSQQAYVKASNAGAGRHFGTSLALSRDGHALVVGASGEGSGATGVGGPQSNNNRPGSGAAYVFRFANGAWAQEAYLKASRAISFLEFGFGVAIDADGTTVAVSAADEASAATGIDGNQDDVSLSQAGAIYVFERGEAGWAQEAYVKASNTGASDRFGYSMAMSDDGTILVAGAPLEDSATAGIGGNQGDDSLASSGAVYVFTRRAGHWGQRNYLKGDPAQSYATFGRSLAISADGETLAVGTLDDSGALGVPDGAILGDRANDESVPDSGSVYLF